MKRDNVALLVVDVQVGAFDGQRIASLDHAESFLENVNTLQRYFRANELPVIFIQDCGDVGGAFEKGTTQWEIHPEIAPIQNEKIIQKNSPSAFEGTKLKCHLDELGAQAVVVCGLHSEHCFTNTSLSAIELGLEVIIVGDAHGTSRPDPTESLKVIDRQNEFLKEKGAVVVLTTELIDLNIGNLIETGTIVIGRVSEFSPLPIPRM